MSEQAFDLNLSDRFFLVPKSVLPLLGSADALQMRTLLLLVSGEAVSRADLCGLLSCLPEQADELIRYWEMTGIFSTIGGMLVPAGAPKGEKSAARRVRELKPPEYSMDEIDAACQQNPELAGLLQMVQAALNKTLSPADTKRLYAFCEFYGVEPAAVAALIIFCVDGGKTSLRYMEKIIIEWDELGVRTLSQAELYLERLNARRSMEGQIRTMFGLGERALTAAESNHIQRWVNEFHSSPELIGRAYEIAVDKKGSLNFAYINGILAKWAQAGIKTPEEAEAADKKGAPQRDKKGGKTHETSLDLDAYSKWMWENKDEENSGNS